MKNNISGVDCQPVAMGVIYLITCRINGKPYVGKTKRSLETRIAEHKRNKSKGNSPVEMAIDKYGWENFTVEILEVCPVEMLNEREKFWIAALNSKSPNGYNLTDGGDGQVGCTQETRAKMSAAKKGKPAHNKGKKGKPHSAETKAKMSAAHKGKSPSNKGKPAHNRGVKATAETRAKLSAAHKGKKHSPETIAKMSAAQKAIGNRPPSSKGRKPSPETKAKISAGVKAAWARRKKAVENGGK